MDDDLDIAIVGLSCRFPGARDAAEFWRNLAAGVESIAPLSDEEILQSGAPRAHLASPNYVKAAPVLDEPGGFDAAFFGFTPREARTMDPQHRILLELAAAALEDAGCDPARFSGRIGVFAGAAMNTYFMHAGLGRNFAQDYIPTLIYNDKDFLATRLSYKLNLKGPSITVQTACSTSLTAVHLARQSLLSEEIDIALAGAISVRVPHRAGYFADAGGVSSPDGRVRAFDAGANGTVFGSGGGVVVLKRLRDALADRDAIRAVIKGSALNNDGAEKAGYTAPSVNSQADAVVEALANADVEAGSISYLEAHGSGTPVGDPIEIRALTKAFRASTQRSGFCAIGSVKTNVGHLDAAAGMAGLIKTVLALQHRQIPASLNYSRPNPEIDFPSTPFYVNTQLTPWLSPHGPRRAGLMSTGMGGTNAHVILEEAPPVAPAPAAGRPALLVLSARTEPALAASAEQLREFLAANPSVDLEDAAFTLQLGRRAFPNRRFVVAADGAGVAALAAKPARLSAARLEDGAKRPLVLLLPGVGDHYVGMGRELYAWFPVFRSEVDRCVEILRPLLGLDLREILYPKGRDWQKASKGRGIDLKKMLAGNTEPPEDEDARRLNQAVLLQPALFTIEYSLARLWADLGIVPQALAGHSMGEYVAACLAGVFSLEDALRLIVRRTQLVDRLPPARMLAVPLPEAELQPLLTGDLSIALINGPNLCVVAGPPAAIEEFSRLLGARGLLSRPVQNTHAFHSRLLDPIVPAFAAEVRKVRLHAPAIPFISNVTGRWITAEEAADPDYWARHTNHTARFHDALQTLWRMENPILLEAGPGRTLGVLAQQHPARPPSASSPAVASLRHHYEGQPDEEILLAGVGRLWLSGVEIRWEHLHREKSPRKIPLPTYPFERINYWLEAPPAEPIAARSQGPATSPSIPKNPNPGEWYYVPSWKRLLPKAVETHDLAGKLPADRPWLVFLDECGVAAALVERFEAAGMEVITVRAGREFATHGPRDFTIVPGVAEHYGRMLESFPGRMPAGIVHAWSITGNPSSGTGTKAFDQAQDLGFFSLIALAGALAKPNLGGECKLFALSNHVQDVHGREKLSPEKSTILGPCLVIPQEFPNLIAKAIDLELPETGSLAECAVDRLIGEFCSPDTDLFVAHRDAHRWVQTYEPADLPAPGSSPPVLREGGAYLITGGMGNVGRELARFLAKNYRAKLVLVGRLPLPARDSWPAWLEDHPEDDPQSRRIRQIAEIEKLGGAVHYGNAHAGDRPAMQKVFEEANLRFGPLHGVIHGAGLVGEEGNGEIRNAGRAGLDLQFQSKACGLLVLDSLLQGVPLDFCLLMSSLTSVLGGIGHAAYTAANLYLDAFARRSIRAGQLHWLSVNWDFWRFQENNSGNSGFGKTSENLGVTGAEAMQVLETALAVKDAGQLIVSTGDLGARIGQWVKLESLRAGQRSTSDPVQRAPRPAGQPHPASPGTEIEETIASVWQEVLGFEDIGLDDSFFDLGGHSILALQIVDRARSAYRVELTLRDLFTAPTVAQFSSLIQTRQAHLSPEEHAGLAEAPPSGQHISRRPAGNRAPLSVGQHQMWIVDQLSPGNPAYNIPVAYRISGELNAGALEESFNAIVKRHEVWRTTFHEFEDDAVQEIHPDCRIRISLTDLTHLPVEERERAAGALASKEAIGPFDLRRLPLLRVSLVKLDRNDHVLLLNVHHIVGDGLTLNVIFDELDAIYRALTSAAHPELPELKVQYADFCVWEREDLLKNRHSNQLEFWRRELGGVLPVLELATDKPRPPRQSFRGSSVDFSLPEPMVQALASIAKSQNCTFFITILAAFQILLLRNSKGEEIIIGSPVSNRSLPETERLIGNFLNIVALRGNLSGNPTFIELLRRTRETALNALSNKDLPFETVVASLKSRRDPSRNPVFQAMMQILPAIQPRIGRLSVRRFPFEVQFAQVDIALLLYEEPDGGSLGQIQYCTDLFSPEAIERLSRQFVRLLHEIIRNPDQKIADPALVSPEVR